MDASALGGKLYAARNNGEEIWLNARAARALNNVRLFDNCTRL